MFRNCNFIKNTPLMYSNRLSKEYNCNIFLKREDLQTTRSFKIRGAFNKIYKTLIKKDIKYNKITAVSAGNHAQGVCYVSNKLNINCDIYIPENTPKQKINSLYQYNNINVIKYGNSFDETYLHYINNNNNNNNIFIHPFNDIDIIEGQGTILNEIYNNIIPDYVISTIGGGGLMSGLINNNNNNYLKQCMLPCLNTKFIGVEPYGSSNMYHSIMNNGIIEKDTKCSFVDGASVNKVGDITFNIIKNNINKIIRIDNDELCYDLINLYQKDGIISELAGTLPISALRHLDKNKIKHKNIVCIISGGNNDIHRINDFINKKNNYINNIN